VTDETRDTETATEEADFDGENQADEANHDEQENAAAEAGESDEDTAQAEEIEEADEADEADEEIADAEETDEDVAEAEEPDEEAPRDEDVAAAEAAAEDEAADDEDVAESDEIDEDADETDETDETDDDAAQAGTPSKRRRNLWGWTEKLKTVPGILVLLLVLTGSAAIWLFYNEYRPDRQTDPRVAHAVVSAASSGTVAMLSYSSDTLDQDFASAKSHLGGDFLSYYDNFTQTIIAPAAKQKSLKTTARVVTAAVSELRGNSAVVLLFVNQTTISRENPKPSVATSSVLVNMTRVDGKWLITKFSPF
jgi:Mce-associated membrane protein